LVTGESRNQTLLLRGLSRMKGNFHVRFLEGGESVTTPCYSTQDILDTKNRTHNTETCQQNNTSFHILDF